MHVNTLIVIVFIHPSISYTTPVKVCRGLEQIPGNTEGDLGIYSNYVSHVFVLQKETRVPWGNPYRHKDPYYSEAKVPTSEQSHHASYYL